MQQQTPLESRLCDLRLVFIKRNKIIQDIKRQLQTIRSGNMARSVTLCE